MSSLYRVMAVCLLGWSLTACNVKVDNSDTESLSDSVTRMSETLKPEERSQLRDALVIIALSETGYLGEPPADAVGIARDAVLGPALMKALDGEDYVALLVRADGLREQKEKRTVEAAERARQEVLARIEQAKAETEHLRGIRIEQARYGWTKGDYLPQAYLEFRLINASGQAISGVRLRGELFTPEKQGPWLHESLTHEMIRSLPDGQDAEYRLIPNQYSAWGTRSLQRRNDTRLQLQVINARVGDAWLVSADLELLNKELKSYEAAAEKARAAISEIRARRSK